MPKQVDNPNSKSSLRLSQAAFSLFGKLYHAPHICARQSYNICEAVACACCRTYQVQFDEHLWTFRTVSTDMARRAVPRR